MSNKIDKIYVDNKDKLWTFLLNMDLSYSLSHTRNKRDNSHSVHVANKWFLRENVRIKASV